MITVDEEQIGHGTGYIMSADCDSFYKAKVSHYFGISQEAAGVHAAVKGCGLKKMMDEEGRTWMILRTRMKLNKMAKWMDYYKIQTWCQEGYRLFCPRIVRAFDDKTGELLFETQNHWVIMNIMNGRPERPSYVGDKLIYPDKEKYWFDPAFPKFPADEEFQGEKLEDYTVSINYFDYDYNRHVNNISYVNWMMEAFPFEFQNEYRPVFIDVEWKRQCHFGDQLTVVTTKDKENPMRFLSVIKRLGEDGTEEVAFHAVSEWVKK